MWIRTRYPYVIYALLCLLGIASPFLNPWGGAVTVWDTLYIKFYGVSPDDSFSFLSYIFHVVVYMGFIYFFQVYITDYLSGRFYYSAIRYSSLARWFIRWVFPIGLAAVALLMVLIALTVVVGLASGQTFELKMTIPDIDFNQVMYQFLINGWLQIMNGILIVFIAAWLFKEAFYNLIVLGVLVLAVLPTFNIGGWLPAGLNSLGYVTGEWEDILRITAQFAVYLLIELGVIMYLFRKKNIAFY